MFPARRHPAKSQAAAGPRLPGPRLARRWPLVVIALDHRVGRHLGRLGQPEEAARALVFLASPLASYITGTTLDVSGGQASHV